MPVQTTDGHDPFALDLALPDRTLAVGPRDWRGRSGPLLPPERICADLDACLANLLADAEDAPHPTSTVPGSYSFVLLHAEWPAVHEPTEQLEAFLQTLVSRHRTTLPILLYRRLDTDLCVRLLRAGLFDAVSVPVEPRRWARLCADAAETARRHIDSRDLQHQAQATSRLLHAQRRLLGETTARVTGGLLRSQEQLEEVNREMTEQMEQLSLLYQFGRELSGSRNWDRTLEGLLQNLTGFVGAAGAALILRSAPGGEYAARRTYRWEETAWDKVVLNLQGQVDAAVAECMLAPGIFGVGADGRQPTDQDRRIIALPLVHQSVRLGFLLLLLESAESRAAVSQRFLPFLQTVQVILSEEMASAQLLDRMRDIGAFNARVLETVSSGIWVLDERGRTVYCNRAARQLLTGAPAAPDPEVEFVFAVGRGRQQQLATPDQPTAAQTTGTGEDLPELFADARLLLDDLDGVLLHQLRDRGGEPFRGEGRIVAEQGETVPVLVQSSTMPGRRPDEVWLVVVADDLREAQKLEAARRHADRLEGLVEMSATLAHEIRNPLMGLSAQAELLAEQLPAGDDRSRYIEVITAEVQRINETITRLLSFVRPYQPRLADTSLLELARDSLELVRPVAGDRSVRLQPLRGPHADADPADWIQSVDGAQIKQVLLNLLINAIDAAPAGGEVALAIGRSDRLELTDADHGTTQILSGVALTVTDDGDGIAPANWDRIFRPFFTTKSSGTGLGLSICHKIITAHGGDIQARRESNRTLFCVLLPDERPQAEPTKSLEAS